MREIKFDKLALLFLEDLANILIDKEYFSFTTTADNYIDDLVAFVLKNIHTAKQNLHLFILPNMGKVCFTFHTKEISERHGISFLKKQTIIILFVISPIITLLGNILNNLSTVQLQYSGYSITLSQMLF